MAARRPYSRSSFGPIILRSLSPNRPPKNVTAMPRRVVYIHAVGCFVLIDASSGFAVSKIIIKLGPASGFPAAGRQHDARQRDVIPRAHGKRRPRFAPIQHHVGRGKLLGVDLIGRSSAAIRGGVTNYCMHAWCSPMCQSARSLTRRHAHRHAICDWPRLAFVRSRRAVRPQRRHTTSATSCR